MLVRQKFETKTIHGPLPILGEFKFYGICSLFHYKNTILIYVYIVPNLIYI